MIGNAELKLSTSGASSINVRLLISPGNRPVSKTLARTVVVSVIENGEV